MFEALEARVARRADELAARRARALAEEIEADLPDGTEVETAGGDVRLAGRGLGLHPALRWPGMRRGR